MNQKPLWCSGPRRIRLSLAVVLLVWLGGGWDSNGCVEAQSLPEVIEETQPKMVKIFGGGGLRRLESWQTGFFVSTDGLIVTVWSYVLDSETTVVLSDGRRMVAELVGYHPQYELALLRVNIQDQPCFTPDSAVKGVPGMTVLAFSNLYGVASGNEQCSVQTGVVSTLMPLDARRGNRRTSYRGPAIVVDAITSNPGAAGGVITDRQGRWVGLIGRESRTAESNLWLNYAIPAEQVAMATDLILAGNTRQAPLDSRSPTEPLTLDLIGVLAVPDVVERTPPFIDRVRPNSLADGAGLRADDLIVQVDGQVTTCLKDLRSKLKQIDRDAPVTFMVKRGDDFINVKLRGSGR